MLLRDRMTHCAIFWSFKALNCILLLDSRCMGLHIGFNTKCELMQTSFTPCTEVRAKVARNSVASSDVSNIAA